MSRHVLLYEPQFAALVITGAKTCTIRRRARVPSVGDVLDHRAWDGVPYRAGSRQARIREDVCTSVTPLRIHIARGLAFIRSGAYYMHVEQAIAFVKRDGFANVPEMVEYLERAHGLPFEGVLIEWNA